MYFYTSAVAAAFGRIVEVLLEDITEEAVSTCTMVCITRLRLSTSTTVGPAGGVSSTQSLGVHCRWKRGNG